MSRWILTWATMTQILFDDPEHAQHVPGRAGQACARSGEPLPGCPVGSNPSEFLACSLGWRRKENSMFATFLKQNCTDTN